MSTPSKEKVEVHVEVTKVKSSSVSVQDEDVESVEKNEFVKSDAEKKLVRKINFAFIPLVCSIIFIQFIDKSTLNFSVAMGLYKDTHITQDQFSWLGAIFYIGYLAFQIPNQFCMQRVSISKYLGVILVIWGACLACMSLATNFAQLAGLRFLLGFWEASSYPCIFLLISTFYRRSEQVVWFSTMFICNAVAIAVGSLIGYGIRNIDGAHGLSAWQWCMIIWGSVTAAFGIVFFFFLPDKAKSRWFRLTPEEEKIVDERSLDNAVVQNRKINKKHIVEALKDPRFYCYFFISLLTNLQNAVVTIFSTQIISQMGFSDLDAILLNIPNGAAVVVLIVSMMYCSRRFDEIGIVAAIWGFISIIGTLLLLVTPPGGSKLVGLYLAVTSPIYILLQTSISSNVTGYTKKIFYTGGNLVAYCIGNFVGPLMMVQKQAPRYIGGMIGYIVADAIAIGLFLYVRWSLVRENRRRQELREKGLIPPPPPNHSELDLTDKEDLNFVYRP